jgi:hypothetical protein
LHAALLIVDFQKGIDVAGQEGNDFKPEVAPARGETMIPRLIHQMRLELEDLIEILRR